MTNPPEDTPLSPLIPAALFLPQLDLEKKEAEPKKKRASKYDGLEDFTHEVFGQAVVVSPSNRGLVEAVYQHYQNVRSEPEYRQQFASFAQKQFLRELEDTKSASERRTFVAGGTSLLRVHASEVKDCARAIYYRLTKEQQGEQPPQWSVLAAVGTHLHREVEWVLRFTKKVDYSELPVRHAAWGGRIDHVINASDEYPSTILDVKQVGDKEFKLGMRSTKMVGFIAQITLYSSQIPAEEGIVLLVNRETGELAEYRFPIYPELAELLVERAQQLQKAAQLRSIPQQEFFFHGKRHICQYVCPYRETCMKED